MRAAFYFDLTVQRELALRGPSGTATVVLAKTLIALHGIGLRQQLEFAAAFPGMKTGERPHPGNVLRVFVNECDDADRFAEAVETNTFLMGYLHIGRAEQAPLPVVGEKTVEYRIFKIPSQRSYGRHPDAAWSSESRKTPWERRSEKLKLGDALPYLRADSASNGQAFSIRVERVVGQEVRSEEFRANSYGLGSLANRVFLPHIVDDKSAP